MGCVESSVAPAAGGGGTSIINMERLKELDCFVLDNSIRETTVGQTKGHTLNTKLKILGVVTQTGISEFVIGSFGAKENVDDKLPNAWRSVCSRTSTTSLSHCWGFCEAWNEVSKKGVPLLEPSGGLQEMALRHQMSNAIIEVDVCTPGLTVDVTECVIWQLRWGLNNLASRPNRKLPRMLVNLRDFADCCVREDAMQHALRLVRKLGALPDHLRPLGLMIEEPTALITPDEMAGRTRKIRAAMQESGWSSGRFLVHVHAGYGLEEAVTLAALSNGCDGIWCAVCKDGAALGHACSAITLTNLARLGNTFVQENYSLPKIVQAAAHVHTIVTGHAPAPRCEVYGSHAFDRTFSGWFGFHDEQIQAIADLLEIKRHVRVSDFATAEMLKEAMIDRFDQPKIGEWDDSLCKQMELTITHELMSGMSIDHNTNVGLVMLYERAGGIPSRSMTKKVTSHATHYHSQFHFMMLKYKWLEVLKRHNLATFNDNSFHYMDMHVDDGDLPDMPWEIFASSFLLPQARLQVLHTKPMEWWVDSPSFENFVTWEHFELRMLYVLMTKWTTEATKHGDYELATANGLLRLMQMEESQVEHIMNVSMQAAKFAIRIRGKQSHLRQAVAISTSKVASQKRLGKSIQRVEPKESIQRVEPKNPQHISVTCRMKEAATSTDLEMEVVAIRKKSHVARQKTIARTKEREKVADARVQKRLALRKHAKQMRALKNCKAFATLTDEHCDHIVDAMTFLKIEHGKVLCQELQPADRMYLLMKGSCTVFVNMSEVATLRELDVFGESALFHTGDLHDPSRFQIATVVATEEIEVLVLTSKKLQSLCASGDLDAECVAQLSAVAEEREKSNALLAEQLRMGTKQHNL